jgi:hypothetical protein
MSDYIAERAETTLHVNIRLRVNADGSKTLVGWQSHTDPVSLSRPNERGSNPWWEGGIAILDKRRACNGEQMETSALDLANEIHTAIGAAVDEIL